MKMKNLPASSRLINNCSILLPMHFYYICKKKQPLMPRDLLQDIQLNVREDRTFSHQIVTH